MPPIKSCLKMWASFSRSYGGILPSSFNAVLSSALVFSTCPPVSVWGTVINVEAISWNCRMAPTIQLVGTTQTIRHSSTGRGILTPFPSTTPFGLRLRSRLTLLRLALSRNPWAFGESVSHTLYRYSCQHSHF